VIEVLTGLEATALAEHLRQSRWTYPLVNAGHVLGIALLVGAVVPMDLRLLRLVGGPDPAAAVAFLRPFAVAGLILAAVCGGLLFIAQANEYVGNRWFQAKMLLLALALTNAILHLRLGSAPPARQRLAAAVSLVLWPAVLLCGRMIGYS
jgi:putative intracellular protease/amidase